MNSHLVMGYGEVGSALVSIIGRHAHVLSPDDFECEYLGKTPIEEQEKCACTCPTCSKEILHAPKKQGEK